MIRLQIILVPVVLLFLAWSAVAAGAADFDAELLRIQHDWAVANYQLTEPAAREAAFETLLADTTGFVERNPQRAEALIWQGIVYSTYAGVKGGLGALSLAKKSRASLEAALQLDASALDGSAYTSLGTLYHKVPGFPIGFGSDRKARQMLLTALEINPTGIDPNYFYAEFLFDEGEYEQVRKYLNRALAAPPRPDRPIADSGRKREIEALLARLQEQLATA